MNVPAETSEIRVDDRLNEKPEPGLLSADDIVSVLNGA